MSFVVKLLAGIVFSAAAAAFMTPLAASFTVGDVSEGTATVAWLVFALFVGVIVVLAPTIRRAFGRGFLILGVTAFLLPLSTLALSGRAAQEVISTSVAGGAEQAATAVGATVGAGLITGFASFVGIILGIIFVVIGLVLVLGGRREVVVVPKGG